MSGRQKIDELRAKRASEVNRRSQAQLRDSHGARLAAIVSAATTGSLCLEDFDPTASRSLSLEWPKDITAAPGLVAPYVSQEKAEELLECFQHRLTAISGKIGFHDKDYMGLAPLRGIDPVSLLTVSDKAEDSVVFYLDDPEGLILVDCYRSQPCEPFSVIVQGDALVEKLAPCFVDLAGPLER